VAVKIRQRVVLLIRDGENRLKWRGLADIWKDSWEIGFLAELQRRGTHVSIPKIGSRGAQKCIGGIKGFYAVLRRE
jgi:hypothetical protein